MTTRRARRRTLGAGASWIALGAALAGLALGFWFGTLRKPIPEETSQIVEGPGPVSSDRRTVPVAEPAVGDSTQPVESTARMRIALVVDDLGRSLADVDRIAALPVPVSVAVLPFESLTSEVVAELRRRGIEILCHMPMESSTGANAGPGALTLGMSRWALNRAVLASLDAVPGAVGVSNHMGSGFTVDEKKMRRVLRAVADRGLFFLDSRTSAESVGYRVAIEIGLPAAQRHIFLDADPLREAVESEFDRALQVAHSEGTAIALGHPHDTTLEVLESAIPRALDAGYEFVRVSDLLEVRN